eukprot:5534569-Prymnesium_polylepis.2
MSHATESHVDGLLPPPVPNHHDPPDPTHLRTHPNSPTPAIIVSMLVPVHSRLDSRGLAPDPETVSQKVPELTARH